MLKQLRFVFSVQFFLFNRLWLIQGQKMFQTLNTLICNSSLGFTEFKVVKELPLQRLSPIQLHLHTKPISRSITMDRKL